MRNTFNTVLESLTALSAEELNRSAERLARSEKRHAAELICHLAEITDRKVYLELGYANIFEYCVQRLGMSEGSVALRRHVANVARRFPQLLEAIAETRISVSVAAKIAPHVTTENVDNMLADCAGMSKRTAEEYVVQYAPKPAFEPSIRRQTDCDPVQEQAPPSNTPITDIADTATQIRQQQRNPVAPEKQGARSQLQPARPDVFNFRFSANRAFKEALVRLAEVLGCDPRRDMAEILEKAVDLALEKKDPQRKLQRRAERERRKSATRARHRPGDANPNPKSARPAGSVSKHASTRQVSRHVPAAIRDRVLARAGHRCEYLGAGGRRCTCRTGLQIEHDPPFSETQSHKEETLKAYCGHHNLLAAERVFGTTFIAQKIAHQREAYGRN